MSLAPDSTGYHRPGEVDAITMHAPVYCDSCDEVTATDVTRSRGVYLFTCPECGAPNEIEDKA